MEPAQVDVIAFAPTAFLHCRHCEVTFWQLGIGARMRRIEVPSPRPPDLQLLAGHRSIASTQLYLRPGDGWLAEEYRRATEAIEAQATVGMPS